MSFVYYYHYYYYYYYYNYFYYYYYYCLYIYLCYYRKLFLLSVFCTKTYSVNLLTNVQTYHSFSFFRSLFYASRCLSFLFGVVFFFFFFFSENEYTLLFGYFFSRFHIPFLSVTLTTVFEYIYIRSFNIAKYLVYEYHICDRQNFVSLKKNEQTFNSYNLWLSNQHL